MAGDALLPLPASEAAVRDALWQHAARTRPIGRPWPCVLICPPRTTCMVGRRTAKRCATVEISRVVRQLQAARVPARAYYEKVRLDGFMTFGQLPLNEWMKRQGRAVRKPGGGECAGGSQDANCP